jgi:probable HAF family extracellular repeat protein
VSHWTPTLFGVGLLVGVLAGAPTADASFVNGDFAIFVPINGTGGGWTSSLVDTAGGWRSTTSENSFEGFFILNSNGSGTDPTLTQAISGLGVGGRYTVRGEFESFRPGNGDPDAFSFGVEIVGLALREYKRPASLLGSFELSFQATATTHTLRLTAERNGDDSSYAVDNVVIINLLPPLGGASFIGLGDLPGDAFRSSVFGVSADGKVAVGLSDSDLGLGAEAFRWTESTGMVGLGDLPGGEERSDAYAVSADGSVVVGAGSPGSPGSNAEAFRWTELTGMVGLGFVPGTTRSVAAATSGDRAASVIAGSSEGATFGSFRWTPGAGMVDLGDLPGGEVRSDARGVSGDGSIIVGWSTSAAGEEAYRWTHATGMVGLGDLPGGPFESGATAISADGRVIVGEAASSTTFEAFRWTQPGGMTALGALPFGSSIALAVSRDGSVIVGRGSTQQAVDRALIWNAHGIRDLQDLLEQDLGLDLTGWTLEEATGISGDGRTIVGNGINPSGDPEGWMAVLRQPAQTPATSPLGAAILLCLLVATAWWKLRSSPEEA